MKKFPSLDFIIIFIFGFWLLQYWNQLGISAFIIFFLLCFVYLWIDYRLASSSSDRLQLGKKTLFFVIIGFLILSTLVVRIIDRINNPSQSVHDNIQQIEVGINFLLQGKNPYGADYSGTAMKQNYYITTNTNQVVVNPALTHVIALPGQFILSLPVYGLATWFWGFYDQRMVYLLAFILSLLVIFSLPQKYEHKYIMSALFATNPLFVPFLFEGRNDVLVLLFIILTIYLLNKKKFLLSSATLALACTTKHFAFFLVPFYYVYIYLINPENFWLQKVKRIISQTWLLPAVFILVVLPFLIWDPAAFYRDVYAYPLGILPDSYPINGYGISVLLYSLGTVKKVTDYIPLWIIQIPVSLAVLYSLIKIQKSNNTLAQLVAGYSVLIFVYLFLSRFLNDNYLGFISQLFILAYFI